MQSSAEPHGCQQAVLAQQGRLRQDSQLSKAVNYRKGRLRKALIIIRQSIITRRKIFMSFAPLLQQITCYTLATAHQHVCPSVVAAACCRRCVQEQDCRQQRQQEEQERQEQEFFGCAQIGREGSPPGPLVPGKQQQQQQQQGTERKSLQVPDGQLSQQQQQQQQGRGVEFFRSLMDKKQDIQQQQPLPPQGTQRKSLHARDLQLSQQQGATSLVDSGTRSDKQVGVCACVRARIGSKCDAPPSKWVCVGILFRACAGVGSTHEGTLGRARKCTHLCTYTQQCMRVHMHKRARARVQSECACMHA